MYNKEYMVTVGKITVPKYATNVLDNIEWGPEIPKSYRFFVNPIVPTQHGNKEMTRFIEGTLKKELAKSYSNYEHSFQMDSVVANDYDLKLVRGMPYDVFKLEDGAEIKKMRGIGDFDEFARLQVLVELNDPKEYTGGKVRFHGLDKGVSYKSGKGVYLIHPMFNYMSIDPVTEGTKYFLRYFICGSTVYS